MSTSVSVGGNLSWQFFETVWPPYTHSPALHSLSVSLREMSCAVCFALILKPAAFRCESRGRPSEEDGPVYPDHLEIFRFHVLLWTWKGLFEKLCLKEYNDYNFINTIIWHFKNILILNPIDRLRAASSIKIHSHVYRRVSDSVRNREPYVGLNPSTSNAANFRHRV